MHTSRGADRHSLPTALPTHAGNHAGLWGGAQVAINALYALMNRCKLEAERARGGEQAARWRRRQEMVLYTLLTHHLQASDSRVLVRLLCSLARQPAAVHGAPSQPPMAVTITHRGHAQWTRT
jgi:hypothetical protein